MKYKIGRTISQAERIKYGKGMVLDPDEDILKQIETYLDTDRDTNYVLATYTEIIWVYEKEK